MAYSRSLLTIRRREHLLGRMLDGHSQRWDVAPGEESSFAYRIRECLHVARVNPRAAHLYPTLLLPYRVTVPRPGVVVAQLSDDVSASSYVPPIQREKVVTEGAQSHLSIVATILANKSAPLIYHFPEAALSRSELLSLHAWSQKHGWLMFLADDSLTIRPDTGNPDLTAAAFAPEDLDA